MTTLNEVAARAGVSARTVSNVVNDYPHVAPQTRARVQQALDDLGYRPNLAARRLRRGRTGMIGLVVPEIASPYFGELASLIVARAVQRGATVLIDETAGNAERERVLLDSSGAYLIDGLIVSPWALAPHELRRRADDIPLVLLGERYAPGMFDHVAVDSLAAATQATEQLLGLGRRRIAAIGVQPHRSNNTAALRLRGYRAALRRAGVPVVADLEVAVRDLHRADGAAAVHHLLDRGIGFDAAFCFTDQLALGAIRALVDRGLAVPQAVAVHGFDDIEDGRFAVPSLSTVAPDKDRIAELALELLFARIGSTRIDSAREPVRDLVAPHRLVARESTLG